MMLSSRETAVDYMMPSGLHHIFASGHYYGPDLGEIIKVEDLTGRRFIIIKQMPTELGLTERKREVMPFRNIFRH